MNYNLNEEEKALLSVVLSVDVERYFKRLERYQGNVVRDCVEKLVIHKKGKGESDYFIWGWVEMIYKTGVEFSLRVGNSDNEFVSDDEAKQYDLLLESVILNKWNGFDLFHLGNIDRYFFTDVDLVERREKNYYLLSLADTFKKYEFFKIEHQKRVLSYILEWFERFNNFPFVKKGMEISVAEVKKVLGMIKFLKWMGGYVPTDNPQKEVELERNKAKKDYRANLIKEYKIVELPFFKNKNEAQKTAIVDYLVDEYKFATDRVKLAMVIGLCDFFGSNVRLLCGEIGAKYNNRLGEISRKNDTKIKGGVQSFIEEFDTLK